jgi:superfamily I DNA/RNA helicase
MRLPNESQLSREQKEVCFAHTDRPMLVTGPPGSGKTVVAIFRQNALRKKRQRVQALVYNHVLCRYTAVESTFYEWLKNWWKSATGVAFPASGHGPQRRLDFNSAYEQACDGQRPKILDRGNWGHIILDEAQDFEPAAHQFLHLICSGLFDHEPTSKRPSITILADENQRLQATNSTIEQLRAAYFLKPDDVYVLRKNYRNTRQIAALAAEFYVGLPTGKPELPSEQGDMPLLVLTRDIDDAVQRIANFSRLHSNQDIGVLVYYKETRRKFFNKLAHRLKDTSIRVQTYVSDRGDENNDPRRHVFEKGGSITVLCFASSKGLEFDSVFLPELQTLPVNNASEMTTKMNLYVMCSRARRKLVLMISDPERGNPVWRFLPTDPALIEIDDSMIA